MSLSVVVWSASCCVLTIEEKVECFGGVNTKKEMRKRERFLIPV